MIALQWRSLLLPLVPAEYFVDFQPATPDNCIALYNESASALPESQALNIDQFGLQVLVRHTDNSAARELAYKIFGELVGFSGDVDGEYVSATYCDTMPASIGRDENNRAEWTAHYRYRLQTNTKHRS